MKNAFRYILLFCYFTVAFSLIGLVIKVVIGFVYTGTFYLPYEGVYSNFFKSIIAGSAITLAAIVFNLIDKFKARKLPPADSGGWLAGDGYRQDGKSDSGRKSEE